MADKGVNEARAVVLQTVDEALRVLQLLAERGQTSVKDVTTELGCSRSSAYRIVRTLQDREWVREVEFGKYELGAWATVLGHRAMNRLPLREVAQPWLRRLAGDTEETATLSLLVSRERVCIDQVESSRQVRMTVQIGKPFPLHAGASGKAILMSLKKADLDAYFAAVPLRRLTPNTILELPALRDALQNGLVRGYVVSVAERDPEAFAVASPIFDRTGVIGSIAICGPRSRYDRAMAPKYGEAVRHAAQQISFSLGHSETSISRSETHARE